MTVRNAPLPVPRWRNLEWRTHNGNTYRRFVEILSPDNGWVLTSVYEHVDGTYLVHTYDATMKHTARNDRAHNFDNLSPLEVATLLIMRHPNDHTLIPITNLKEGGQDA